MKGISKALLGLGAAAVMVMVSMPIAEAQCASARILGAGSGNNTDARIRITPPGVSLPWTLGDDQIGSIWQVGNPAINSGSDHFGGGGNCPASNWVTTGGMFPGVGNMAIFASVASPTCLLSNCPPAGATVITVVEDMNDDGSNAGFAAYTVDETPAGLRWYDHDRIEGGLPLGINARALVPFPTVDVTSSAGPPPNTNVISNYADLAMNVSAADGPANTPQPASGSIQSYDIMQATGMSDPGRSRSAYTLLKSIPYGDAGVVGDGTMVPCADTANDTWLAVGVTFVDGVESVLVGAATAVECDPAIADPNDNKLDRNRDIRPRRTRSSRRGR